MLLNLLLIAVRNALRHKMYASITIGGLALGLACSILIGLWVTDELNYDRFHEHAGYLYRANWDFKRADGNEGIGPGTPPPLAALLANNIPGVVSATRLRPMSNGTVRSGETVFNEDGIVAADSNVFDLLSFPLVEGDPSTALSNPNSVVITAAVAKKLFGNEPAVGKTLLIDEPVRNMYGSYENLFRVTGIVEDPPPNSHIQFSMLTSMSSYPEVRWRNWSWVWMQVATYVRLREGVSSNDVEAAIPGLVATHSAAGFRRLGMSYEDLTSGGLRYTFVLQPMNDIYLGSRDIGNRLGPVGDSSQVTLLSTIAILVLATACINFMNLATAKSAGRSKEIGIRKVLGSRRRMLVGQFMLESCFFSFLSLPIALLLVDLGLDWFNDISGKSIDLASIDPAWIPGLILLTAIVGIVSGSYPGLQLSSISLTHSAKGMSPSGSRGKKLRNVLVATQFAVTIGIVACAMLVHMQMEYVRQKDLGFDKNGVVVISNKNERLGEHAEAFRSSLRTQPRIVDVCLSSGVPPGSGFMDGYRVDGQPGDASGMVSYLVDEHFLSTMQIPVTQGRGFAEQFSDSASVILNAAAVRMFGLSDPIGKTLVYPGGDNARYTIVGVVPDFNFRSLYAAVGPFGLFHRSSRSYMTPESYVLVRVHPEEMKESVDLVRKQWNDMVPGMPFEYSFLDESIASGYASAARLGSVFRLFSGLSIVIACIGLFGLAAYSTERRTKEIGVRKVLGATEASVVAMLSREFSLLIIGANIVAWPAAWYVADSWLQNFAYRIEIEWWVFAVSGVAALCLALGTVVSLAIKAARANPVESLRYE